MRPEVLLLDEPTANLDPDGVVQVVGAVDDVLRQTHATMVLVEHRADRWIDMIDRVVVLGLERTGRHPAGRQQRRGERDRPHELPKHRGRGGWHT